MTDSENIKAFECCEANGGQSPQCDDCPYHYTDEKNDPCYIEVRREILKILNRQQAKIERLQNLTEKDFEHTAISTVERHQKWIKYRAIKEFAKKIRQKISAMVCSPDLLTLDDYDKCIDDVLKEMVGDE